MTRTQIRKQMAAAFGAAAISLSALFAVGCGSPAERIKEREAQLASTPTPTPGERPLGGSFLITGSSANDMNPYTGSLTVAPKGDNYEFRWSATKGSRIGTGVQIGNSVAVSFATTGGGKGCGVFLYKVDTVNGTLDGRSAEWGSKTYSSEKGTRIQGTSLGGRYKVTGKGTNGRDYSDTLDVTKNGEGYVFVWFPGENTYGMPILVGFGMWHGSYAAASFGGPQCGVVLYDIQSNGSLEGVWGGQKQVTFGKETAKIQ